MPAFPLFPARKIVGEKIFKDVPFHYVIYQNPISLPDHDKQTIVETFGNRIVKGEVCLDITAEDVIRDLNNGEYSVIAFVRNATLPDGTKDEGSGALQYYDWCETGTPQLWINDLCRVSDLSGQAKPQVSPIECLLSLFEDLANEKRIQNLYLMVDHDKQEILPPIYTKYGFDITPDCAYKDSIIMRKPLLNRTRNRNRSRSRSRSRSRRSRRTRRRNRNS